MLLGYARVSILEQDPALQRDALRAAGCVRACSATTPAVRSINAPAGVIPPSKETPYFRQSMTGRPENSLGSHAQRAVGGVVLSKSRLEALSDGVFAIAITLLVLDLGIGAAAGRHLLRALVDLWPSYLAYMTSFFMIGLVWMGHHVIVSISTGVDRRLLKINLALLFVVAFLPFPTKLLGEFIPDPAAERVAAVFYGSWLLLVSGALAGMWRYVSGKRRLLPDHFSQDKIDHITRIFRPNIALYGFGIALALILPQVAVALYLITAVAGFIRTA